MRITVAITTGVDQAMLAEHPGETAGSADLVQDVVTLCTSLQLLAAITHRGVEELPPRQRVTLQLLVAGGPMRVSDLARQIGVSNPTMTGILDRLEARGLLVRERDQRDRRVTVVRATPAGEELITRETTPLSHLSRALERLSEAERADVARGLRLLVGALSTQLVGRPRLELRPKHHR